MTLYCEDLDRTAISGYLETNRPENVAFYQRSGFEVTQEMPVLRNPELSNAKACAPEEISCLEGYCSRLFVFSLLLRGFA
jgi:hypothetical protein